jgi:hypothetical protein
VLLAIWHNGRIEACHVRNGDCPTLACFAPVPSRGCSKSWCPAWLRYRSLGRCPEQAIVVDPPRWSKEPGGWSEERARKGNNGDEDPVRAPAAARGGTPGPGARDGAVMTAPARADCGVGHDPGLPHELPADVGARVTGYRPLLHCERCERSTRHEPAGRGEPEPRRNWTMGHVTSTDTRGTITRVLYSCAVCGRIRGWGAA